MKKRAKKKFIQSAIKHPGALTREASKVHETPMEFAREHKHSAGKVGKRARFALELKKFGKHKKKKREMK